MSVTNVGVKCLLLSTDGSSFLALRRTPGIAQQPEDFDIPGGLLEHGEEPIAGLLREVVEEVGLLLSENDDFTLLDAGNVVSTLDRHIVRLTYACVIRPDDITPVLSEEHTSWCWRCVEQHDGYHYLLNQAIRVLLQRRAERTGVRGG